MLDAIRPSWQDMMDRPAAAKAPKTTLQYFIPEGCMRLMMICGVMNEGDLLEI
jgi:hypothetical protein